MRAYLLELDFLSSQANDLQLFSSSFILEYRKQKQFNYYSNSFLISLSDDKFPNQERTYQNMKYIQKQNKNMRKKIQYYSQSIRRIKTENNSRTQSTQYTPSSSKSRNNYDEFRLPSIKDKQSSYDSGENLYMIHEQQSLRNKQNHSRHKDRFKSATRAYNEKKIIQRSQKIFQSLCRPKKSPRDLISFEAKNVKLNQPNIEVYEEVRQMYEAMKNSRKTKDVQTLLNFIEQLKSMNNLFVRIDDILSLILLKRGKISEYDENMTIYYQNQQKTSLYILLWGEIKLKQIHRNKVKYLIPGDFLCEEVILVKNERKNLFGDIAFSKGSYITTQTAKTQTKCGILQISRVQFEQIRKRFVQNSEKEKIFIFERILTWSLSKKTKFRK